MTRSMHATCAALIATAIISAGTLPAQVTITRQPDGVTVKTSFDTLRVTVCGPTSIHVVASPDGTAQAATPKQPWLIQGCTPGKFNFTMPRTVRVQPAASEAQTLWQPSVATLDTGTIKVLISLAWGNLEFQDEQGHRLLQEFQDAPRRYVKTIVNGENLYSVKDQFYPAVQEAIYGLGQHQNGMFNYRGSSIELAQANTDITIPLMVSTNGYGFFWNTAAESWFDNRFPSEIRFSSNASHAIDYYFLYGPEFDQIIHQYREMTGHVPDVRRMGLRILAVEGPLQERRRPAPHRERIPRRQRSHRQYRAGLVLVGAPGRS